MPYLFFTLSVFAVLLFPQLSAGGGMFFDGVTYSAIARNLAQGVGTFWSPHYTETTYPQFFEHPPLGFAVQSVIYRLFPDTFAVDVLWGILMGGITLWLLAIIWRREHGPEQTWWPLFLWLCFPLTSWALKNNSLENIVVVFVVGAVLFVNEAFRGRSFLFSFLAGALLGAGFFTKGPVALFPLVAPFCHPSRDFRRAGVVFAGLAAGAATFALLLFLPDWGAAESALRAYANQQVMKSLQGMRELSPSRLYLLKRLLSELVLPAAIAGGLAWRSGLTNRRRAFYYLGIGFSGSLPLLISPKQMGWYLVPSLPFFALGIAELCQAGAARLEEKASPLFPKRMATLLILLAVVGIIVHRGKVERDPEIYADLVLQDLAIPPRSRVTVCDESLMAHWSLIAVIQRFRKLSLTTEKTPYLLKPVGAACPVPAGCRSAQSRAAKAYAVFVCD